MSIFVTTIFLLGLAYLLIDIVHTYLDQRKRINDLHSYTNDPENNPHQDYGK